MARHSLRRTSPKRSSLPANLEQISSTPFKKKFENGEEGSLRKRKRQKVTTSDSEDVKADSTDFDKTRVVAELSSSFDKLFTAVMNAKDEHTKEIVSGPFVELPSKKLYPDYYSLIKTPIALSMIERKIPEYSSLQEMKEDLHLMVQNAKKYNEKDSPIYKYAQTISRLVKGWRPPTVSLMQYMSELLQELGSKTDPETGRSLIDVFQELPSKKDYPDYYQIITEPISFDMIQRKLKKKQAYTNNFSDFVKDVCLLFDNAMKYNEDGSIIYKDASLLKNFFLEHIEKVKSQIPSFISESLPSADHKQTLKLKLGSSSSANSSPGHRKIVLSLNSTKDDVSRKRAMSPVQSKKEGVKLVVALPAQDSRKASKDKQMQSPSAKIVNNEEEEDVDEAVLEDTATNASANKVDASSEQNDIESKADSQSEPNDAEAVEKEASSAPEAIPEKPAPEKPLKLENVWEKKKTFDNLISMITISTSQQFQTPECPRDPISVVLPTISEFTSQVCTLCLPATRSALSIVPTLSPTLVKRPHQITVSANGKKLLPVNSYFPQMASTPKVGLDVLRTTYEVRFAPGMNCLEILISAAKVELTQDGKPIGPIGLHDMERERTVIFIFIQP